MHMVQLCRRLQLELRLCWSWLWILPPLGVALGLVMLGASGTPAAQHPFVVREGLEVALPLVGVFVAVPLLEAEWMRRTLPILAVRTRLLPVLLIRVMLVTGYLGVVVAIGVLASLASADFHAPEGSASRWLLDACVTALPPTLLLMTLSLLATNGLVSATAGYLIGVAYWVLNLVAAVALPGASPLRAVLLFGWSVPPRSGDWLLSKGVLAGASILFLWAQWPVLRREDRFLNVAQD